MIIKKITVLLSLIVSHKCMLWDSLYSVPEPTIVEDSSDLYDSKIVNEFVAEVERLKSNQGEFEVQTIVNRTTSIEENVAKEYIKGQDPNELLKEMSNFTYSQYNGFKEESQVSKPGVKMLLSYESLINLINCFLPGLIAKVLENPMDVKFDYLNISLKNIFIQLTELDISAIQLAANLDKNILSILFPPIKLTLIINMILNMGVELSGNVTSDLELNNIIVSLQFYDDFESKFFKPRLRLMLNEFSVSDSVLNLVTTFPSMPSFLTDSIMYLFNNTIMDSLQNYVRSSFVEKGSLILNFLIDKKYPEIYNPIQSDIRISTLMTRAPTLTEQGLMLSMAGDIFSTNMYDEFKYFPTDSENTLMEPSLESEQNIQLLLSETFIKKTLNNYLNKRMMTIDSCFTSFKYYTLDVLNSTIVVDRYGISLNELDLHLFTEEPVYDEFGIATNVGTVKEISLSIMIDSLDLMNGTLYLKISNLKLINWGESFFTSILRMSMNAFSHMMVQLFKNGTYPFPKVKLKPGLRISSLGVTYGDQFIKINGKLDYQSLLLI